jgi:glycosyltransferase involved in cell wall biosynthesis
VPPEDSGALQDSIEHVLAHPDEAREMGQRARRRVMERYSWEAMDQILREVIESVASKPAPGSARSKVLTEGLRRSER